jgi:cyclophilin family peptidyl-prolyl cis-trans isomerase
MRVNLYLFSILILLGSCGRSVSGGISGKETSQKGNENPRASFEIKSLELQSPSKLEIQNTSVNATDYEWDFDDGCTSIEENPTHIYKNSGNFTVVLKAKKGNIMSEHKKKVVVEAPTSCMVEIETPFGNMVVSLSNSTPKHRDNFIKLVEEGYYENLLFHRVIAGFMIQGGDPNSRGAQPEDRLGVGGPGYTVPAEFVDTMVHVKGALAAARSNNPMKESSGSQFYIVQGKPYTEDQLEKVGAMKGLSYSKEQKEIYSTNGGTPQLDNEYTVFGQIVKGLDVIDKIAASQTGLSDRPVKDVTMKMRIVK